MANLQPWQIKLTPNRLYRTRLAPSRNIGNIAIIPQGVEGVDNFSVYIALDGATPDTNPASLAEMSKINTDISSARSFQSFDFNFLAVTQSAGGSIYVSGLVVEDIGAIV